MMRKLSCCILFLLALLRLSAQYNNFKSWSVRQGLPQSDIYCLLQDSRGYIWIGTGGGASMYDGVRFRNYNRANGLPGTTVRALFEDREGRIWFGTNEGCVYLDGQAFHRVNNKKFKGTTTLCFAQDLEGVLYAGTDDGGLNAIVFKGDSLEVMNISEEDGLGSNSVFDLAVDNAGKLWVATLGGGLSAVQWKNNQLDCVNFRGSITLPSDQLLSVAVSGSSLWLGSMDAGAFELKISADGQKLTLLNTYNTSNHLSSDYVWDILPLDKEEVWFATMEKGIVRKLPGRQVFQHFDTRNGLNSDQVLSLMQDRQKNIWIGTNGNGLNMLAGDHFSHYSVKEGLPDNKVQAITQDALGKYWIATSGGGLCTLENASGQGSFSPVADPTGLTKYISCMCMGGSRNKNLWLGTSDHGIARYDGKKFYNFTEKDGLINNQVYAIAVDSNGIVWCGTADGISRFDGVRFLNISTEKMMMQAEGVKAIVEDAAHNMWFATSGGLARYKGEDVLRTFDEVEGLSSKDVNALAAADNGDIYIGTNAGKLFRYNHLKNDTCAIEPVLWDSVLQSSSIRSLRFVNDSVLLSGTFAGFDKIFFDASRHVKRVVHYSAADGFTGVECNDNALYRDGQQNFWFGTVNGLTRYTPSLEQVSGAVPKVYITDVQMFFKEVRWQDKAGGKRKWFNVPLNLELPYNENHLTFKFQCLDFTNPENILYRYKLSGRDEDWSPARKNSEETFSGLAPGSYTLLVMAQDRAGSWSEPTSFSFVINPPWYKTKTFYMVLLILVVAGVYGYIRWRERKLVREKEVLEGIVRERTQEVIEQKHVIEEKHKEITDSINYAERIQRSFMASRELLDRNLREYFVMFQPKDVVSGDFYWAEEIVGPAGNKNFILATADSTGHGVPGAIMSLLNITSLEKAIEHLNSPQDILNNTRKNIISRLKKDGSAEGGKDGMDCSLIVFDFTGNKLYIAAANNPVWIVRRPAGEGLEPELLEIKPDKMPVGKHDRDQESFTLHTIDVSAGDVVYTLTDGFPDQFGGEKGKKFMSKNLKELLLRNSQLSMSAQKELLVDVFRNWVGAAEQIDDVTVIGIRI